MPEKREVKGRLLLGVAGWSYDDWKGVVYPSSPPRRFDPLSYIAGFVDLVEINSTFYNPCTPRTAESWAGKAAGHDRFRFTAKLFKGFTHSKPEQWDRSEIERYQDGIRPLEEAGLLGAVLAQFPSTSRLPTTQP